MKKIKIKISYDTDPVLAEMAKAPFRILSITNAVEVQALSSTKSPKHLIGDRLTKDNVDALCADRRYEVQVTIED